MNVGQLKKGLDNVRDDARVMIQVKQMKGSKLINRGLCLADQVLLTMLDVEGPSCGVRIIGTFEG